MLPIGGYVTEGGAAHTNNLCKKCYNERQHRQGERPVKAVRWRELMEHDAFRGTLWVAFGMEQYLRRMWELFTDKKSMGQSSLVGCGKRKAGRNTRQLAKGVAIQVGSGIGQALK